MHLENKQRQYWCSTCRRHFTVRVNTIFHRSHVPLDKWLYAIYLITVARKGISSMQLSKEIGVTQKTAWYQAQRIREAFNAYVTNGTDADGILSGIVEVDEAYFGGRNDNRHERKRLSQPEVWENKTKVLVARERGTGRVRTAVVGNVTNETLTDFIYSNVTMGSVVCTDDFPCYTSIENDYVRKSVCHSAKEYVNGQAHTNGAESFWALLKRAFYGTYHYFSTKHAHCYTCEFAFRAHEGSCKRHSYERLDAALERIFTKRTTYKQIIAA